MMKRYALTKLSEWLGQTGRKPLVIRGARQVGKTHLVRQFAKTQGLELLDFNFEKNPELRHIFDGNDVKHILSMIETKRNQTIDVTRSLLFLDEIQVVPELLAKLRWFAEDLPALPVIATGSLLDFVLADHSFSMPVGRISYFHLEPITFEEFLEAIGRNKLASFLQSYNLTDEMPLAIHQELILLLKEYFLVGGLPAAVSAWVHSRSLLTVSQIQQDLLATYRDDFTKYTSRIEKTRLEEVFISIPRQLGRKFVFSHVSRESKSSTIKRALDLISMAGICHPVHSNHALGIPLASGKKPSPFKAVLLDVGLVTALMGLNAEYIYHSDFQIMGEGGMAEQFVGQMLRTLSPYFLEPELYYWVREDKTSCAELDYIIQHGAKLVPIEVKAGRTGTLKSLHLLMGLRSWPTAVRFNTDLPSVTPIHIETSLKQIADYQLLSLPLYLIGQLHRLLNQIPTLE